MQADVGVPEDRVRLLTRTEAGALADQAQSAAVEERAAKVAGLQDFYGPLLGRAMKELSEAGLDPRLRALAWVRHTPALARRLAASHIPYRQRSKKGRATKDTAQVWGGNKIFYVLLVEGVNNFYFT